MVLINHYMGNNRSELTQITTGHTGKFCFEIFFRVGRELSLDILHYKNAVASPQVYLRSGEKEPRY